MSDLKSYPFPVLTAGSMDYIDCSYDASIKRSPQGADITVSHHFSGGGLIGRFLQSRAASFACIVSLRSTMYRRLFISDSTGHSCEQQINYTLSGYGQDTSAVETPMFRPIIIVNEDIITIAKQEHKLCALWSGCELHFPKGSIIATCDWERFGGGEAGLLVISKDDELSPGQLYVQEDAEGGFRFQVHVSADIFDILQRNSAASVGHANSIFTHALSEGFRILKERFHENEWKEHANLRMLAHKLKQMELPHWDDDNFDPSIAATTINPHVFSSDAGDDDDN